MSNIRTAKNRARFNTIFLLMVTLVI